MPTAEGQLAFLDESYGRPGFSKHIMAPDQTETQFGGSEALTWLAWFGDGPIANLRVYHFHDTSENSPIRSSTSLNEPEQLAADGGNLPAFPYYLQETHRDAFERVRDTVRQIAPFIGSFILRPEALNENLIRLRWRHVGRDEVFDVSDLSDGTLRFIALTALLLQPLPPSTIVLDEPELGLHPAALAQLAAIMH